MVITRLIGGLGNQMFQYAAGKRLSCALNAELKLDTSLFETTKYRVQRQYALDVFSIDEAIASPGEVRSYLPRNGIWRRLLGAERMDRTYYKERYFHFDPAVLCLTGEVFLEGYWQSERYFSDVAGTIREAFQLKTPLEGRNKELAEHIAAVEAVSLHVRRGDYVADETTHHRYGVCGIDYYQRAISHIAEHVERPELFIFSDDPEWARSNLKFSHPMTFIDHNPPAQGYEDMRLMSLCRHHIIANSSFSWWGAWLNSRPDKIVIAPRNWFDHYDVDTSDLYPQGWLKF